jgi:hypothetical protein
MSVNHDSLRLGNSDNTSRVPVLLYRRDTVLGLQAVLINVHVTTSTLILHGLALQYVFHLV